MVSRKSSKGYEDLEMDQYEGMEVNEYPVNDYPDGPVNHYPGLEAIPHSSDDGKDSPFHAHTQVYEDDAGSRLRRDLKTRQIAMIGLGGALGTGLLINTGPTLAASGPGSMLIGYALVGVLCFAVMAALGEMAAWLPIASGFTGFAHRFVDPALGFAVGWNYWFKYIITTPNNIIAAVLVIKYWFAKQDYDGPGSNAAIYVSILLFAIILINYFGVAFFGEFEFWLSSIKVFIMLFLILFTFSIACGAGPNHDATGFRYWSNPGAFAPYRSTGHLGRFLGFWNVLTSAVFSFLGAELVGVTVGEAQNPRKAVPKAIKLTFFRIVFFYIVLVFFLGLNVPYDSKLLLSANRTVDKTVSAEASPFVVAAVLAGVSAMPNVINICLLIFTFSAANSDLYIATRSLYSLSLEGNAPQIFSRTNSKGVPIYALGLSSAFCFIAFICVDVGAFETFQYFMTLVTIFGILTWISILISHIYFVRARKAQNIPDTALAYVSPFGITGSYIALIFACVITFFNGWATFTYDPIKNTHFDWRKFIVSYVGVVIYLGMVVGYKLLMKSEMRKPENADLFGGKAQIDRDEDEFVEGEIRRRGGRGEKKWERWYRVTLGNFF